MRGIWRNRRGNSGDGISIEAHTANLLSSWRQRLYEDPDYKQDLLKQVLSGIHEKEAHHARKSRERAAEYGDRNMELPDTLHATRSSAFTEILQLLQWLADEESALDPPAFIAAVRKEVGWLAREAYFQGELALHPDLRDGALGVIYPDVGLVVVWERVRGLEVELDGLTKTPIDPDEDPTCTTT